MANNDNPVWTTDDGSSWTQRTMPTTGASRPAWFGVCWDSTQAKFICVGRDGVTNNNQVAYSADGISWTEEDPGVATPEPWRNCIANTSGVTVAVADNTNNDGLSAMTIEAGASLPVITSLTPNSGYTRGGAASAVHTIQIDGTNFVNGATVTFDGISATSVVFVNSTQLTCVYPPHAAAGVVACRVTNPDTNFDEENFTYIAPFITSVTPSSGPQTGGTNVSIVGDGFLAGSEVTFDDVPAPASTFVDTQHYTATSPRHAVGLIRVKILEP
jgi:hypothetical protein